MKRKAFSRAERKEQIQNVFVDNIQRGLGNELTMYDVARKLDLTPSTKLQKIMLEMVDESTLSVRIENYRQTWKRVFSLMNITRQVRNIRINGVQMELEI